MCVSLVVRASEFGLVSACLRGQDAEAPSEDAGDSDRFG